jgi:hypothetical protein
MGDGAWKGFVESLGDLRDHGMGHREAKVNVLANTGWNR